MLSTEGVLFLEMIMDPTQAPSKSAELQVCYASEVLRGESLPQPVTPPPCMKLSLDGSAPNTAVPAEKAPASLRFKLNLTITELPAITVILRDPKTRQSLRSSKLDFKTPGSLGDVLTFSPKQVTCQLDESSLVPRFGKVDPDRDLMEQVR